MKTLFLTLAIMLSSCSFNSIQLPPLEFVDGEVYLVEYAMKKSSQANIGFVIVDNDTILQEICFTVNFSGGKVRNVVREEQRGTNIFHFKTNEDGTVLLQSNSCACYNDEAFKNDKKRIPDKYYTIISPSFLKITNKERLETLYKLSN